MLLADQTVYLNGDYSPLSEAKISVMDRGFLFGDGVYEVIPVFAGKPFRLTEHLRRLEQSLSLIRLQQPMTDAEWEAVFNALIAPGGGDQYIYLQVTRGVAAKRDHAFPTECHPTVFVMCSPISPLPARDGVRAITLADIRWHWCHIKAITLLANVLLRQQAVEQNVAEAILVRGDFVTEGAASNVFLIRNGTLATPPKGPDLLPGITRDLVIELAKAHSISVEERAIQTSELWDADEIWLTSSTREILPVVELDGKPVGDGCPGAIWRRLDELYQTFKAQLRGAPV